MFRSHLAERIFAVVLVHAFVLIAASAHAQGLSNEESAPLVGATAIQTLDVVASDFKFEPQALTLNAGPASFSIRNQGVIDHDFVILDAQRQVLGGSEILAPGRSGTFDATLSPGSYAIVCTLPGHREVGMVGELTVNP
jgi:uncharacterized cupredoxin-like copper-binding protein